jgi:uncharacterized membrane protein (DUF106 family)
MLKTENNNLKKNDKAIKEIGKLKKESKFLNEEFLKKESKSYFILAILIPVIIFVGLLIFIFKVSVVEYIPEEESLDELQKAIESITAPEGVENIVPEEVIKSVTAPLNVSEEKINQEVLDSLTASNQE